VTTTTSDNWQWLELAAGPKRSHWAFGGKKRVLHIAINMPGYYSLPVRILSLMAAQDDELSAYFDSRYVEIQNCDPLEPLQESLADWQPDIVAFSVNIWNRDACIDVAETLRARCPEITILGGGQEVSYSVYDFLALAPAFDYLIDGEGEIPLRQFLTQWQTSGRHLENPQKVSGLHYRDGNNHLFSRPAEIVDDLDAIPSPILAGLVPVEQKNLLGVMLEGARGCPFRCAFCFEGTKKPRVRMASVARLKAEAEYMSERGARFFHIMDAILCNSEIERLKQLKEIFVGIRQKNPSSVVLVEAYTDRITDEVAQYMDAFSIIDLGLQTINPATARAINRPFDAEKYRQGLKRLHKTGSTFNVYLICGLPHETLNSFFNGIRFVLQQRPTRIFNNELCLLNGTELRRRAEEYGYEYDPKPPYDVYANKWMTRLEFKFAYVVSKVIERYYNFTVRAIFAAAPWLPKQVNTSGENGRISLASSCSHRCPGCRHAQGSGEPKTLGLETLKHATDYDVDIVAGDSITMNRDVMQLAGQLQLCGSARNRLIAPLSTFAQPELLETLIQRGFWHYRAYCTAADGGSVEPGMSNEELAAHFNRPFELAGNATFKPYLDIVLHPGTSTPQQYRAELMKLIARKATTITVPTSIPGGDHIWQSMLTETFWDALAKNAWIRLPEATLMRALGEKGLNDVGATIDYLRDFDLISQEQETPPCFSAWVD